MFKNYQNAMLRVVVGLMIGLAFYLLLDYFVFDTKDLGIFRVPELLITASLVGWLVHRFPRHNYAAWLLVAYLIVGNAIWMEPSIQTYGRFSTNPFFVLPILFFFFLGTTRGALVNVIFFGWLFLQLPMHQWDPYVYGEPGVFFLVSYVIVGVVSFCLEWIRGRVRNHSMKIAEIDTLTGLPNRSGFLLLLEAEINRGEPFYLVQMDLDHFLRINLTTGSQYADHLLNQMAQELRKTPHVHAVARHYGDEFAFLVDQSKEGLKKVVELIQLSLDQMGQTSEYGIQLTASFGATHFPTHSQNGQELWSQAEMALRKAKEEGRIRLRIFNEKDAMAERDVLRMVESLRNDIENKTLTVFFQPKICIHTKTICGMEALARWNHPQWGAVPPAVFIPLAEQHGFIIHLGNYVFEQSIAFLSSMKTIAQKKLNISVNISAAQLSQPTLGEQFVAICRQYQVQPSQVFLEITESLLLHGGMGSVLDDLRAKGFGLSLDDFGTGYSSMSYLNRYHFDELKVDKSFTDGLLRSGEERHVFRSILELSKGLGMKTVVEGVETAPQVATIESYGAPEIQGWVFAKAMPAEEFIRFYGQFDYDEVLGVYEDSKTQTD